MSFIFGVVDTVLVFSDTCPVTPVDTVLGVSDTCTDLTRPTGLVTKNIPNPIRASTPTIIPKIAPAPNPGVSSIVLQEACPILS